MNTQLENQPSSLDKGKDWVIFILRNHSWNSHYKTHGWPAVGMEFYSTVQLNINIYCEVRQKNFSRYRYTGILSRGSGPVGLHTLTCKAQMMLLAGVIPYVIPINCSILISSLRLRAKFLEQAYSNLFFKPKITSWALIFTHYRV